MLLMIALASGITIGTMAYPATSVVRQSVAVPEVNVNSSATAGSQMFERLTTTGLAAVQIDEDASFGQLFGKETVTAASMLAIARDDDRLVACQIVYKYNVLCLTDLDKDGRFDKIEPDATLFSSKLNPPRPYHRGKAIPIPEGDTFKQNLVYLGMAGSTLRLSYREFINDMARPAFTEEVTFNLSGKYPETVAYKDLVIDVLGTGNAGLSYVIRAASAAADQPKLPK